MPHNFGSLPRWQRLAMDVARLAAESQQVIWLRCFGFFNADPGGLGEAVKMTTEKPVALLEAQEIAAQGNDPLHSAELVVRHYRKRVRANRNRLTRDAQK